MNIVPIDYFLDVIKNKTGWDKDEFLKRRDIGNVERKIGMKGLLRDRALVTYLIKR